MRLPYEIIENIANQKKPRSYLLLGFCKIIPDFHIFQYYR